MFYIQYIIKNAETFIDANDEVGLRVNAEKPKYMLLSCHQDAEQNHVKDSKRIL
jgi:hypothetical protein